MKLSDLRVGCKAYISHVDGDAAFVKRLMEMGFIAGEEVKVASKAPLADPREYIIRGTSVTLRTSEARQIKVAEERQHGCTNCDHCTDCCLKLLARAKPSKTLHIALLGNPNCGKTTLFNRISNGHEHEANYAGCTVDSHVGVFEWCGVRIEIVDLPGTYSLTSFSPEEKYVENYLKENRPDLIINVIDATNLQRNLFLTTQLYGLGIPMVGALNMFDELEKRQNTLDVEQLGSRLGFPCHAVVSRTGRGLHELFDDIVDYDSHEFTYPQFNFTENDSEDEQAQARFAFITKTLEGIYRMQNDKERLTRRIDNIVTHKFWGYSIFILILYAMFELTFILGDYPMQFIEWLVALIGEALTAWLPESWFRDLLVDGIIGGLGSVIVFLPNILILYFCISLLEDSGYMSRAAYIMDRLMRAIGLHGRSFIPMIMGFGCNGPAIMASRSIENRRSRLITMLVIPFMSCSARLPIYLLFAGVFFPECAGLALVCIYLLGIVVALFSAKILDLTISQRDNRPYLMELPPYRMPFLRSAVRRMWDKGSQYLRKMGSIILFASILVWTLGYFPHNDELTTMEQQEQSYLGQIGKAMTPVFAPMGADWRMDVSILAGLSAKEVVVSTLGILYDADAEEDEQGLQKALARNISPAAAIAFVIFTLLYMPCFATVTAIARETGRWKWALLSALYSTSMAWVIAVAAYNLSRYLLG